MPLEITQITVPDIHAALEDIVPYFYDYPGKKNAHDRRYGYER
ncbi:MAG: hypothetical protein ACLSSS_07700 [Megasphaera micronuciformis]